MSNVEVGERVNVILGQAMLDAATMGVKIGNRKFRLDLSRTMFRELDPKGLNTIAQTMIHNDGPDIRAIMLLKYKGNEAPHTARIDMPIELFNELCRTIEKQPDGEWELVDDKTR